MHFFTQTNFFLRLLYRHLTHSVNTRLVITFLEVLNLDKQFSLLYVLIVTIYEWK